MTCHHYHKVVHLSKNCRYWTLAPKEEDTRVIEKVNVNEICNQMGKTWKIKIKEIGSYNVVVADTSSNGSGDTCTTN